jgi:hypothetical protein
VAYEPRYERFEGVGSDGRRRVVEFKKAGFLALGDQPELYFFEVAGAEAVVGISGDALRRFQHGLLLKRRIEAGTPLVSEYLLIRDEDLAGLASDLGLIT